ncbi:MAG TPA: hypothetical protein VGH43_02555 [Jatrophihabitans sp.]|jgi:type II secretory pathway pseudopilin PulG
MARSTTSRSSAGRGVSEDGGFTLLESVVALTMFIIVLTFGALGVTETIRLTGTTSAKVSAANIATEELERLRFNNLTGHGVQLLPPDQTIPNGYTVTNSLGTCTNGSETLTVSVAWGDGTHSVVYDSELAC